MSKSTDGKRKNKIGNRKRRRYRRFWQRVTEEKFAKILELARHFAKDQSDAFDLAQTVVLRLLKYCPSPVSISNLDGYMFETTKNAWIDSARPTPDVSLTELEEKNSPQLAVLDPRLLQVLDRRDNIKLLEPKPELKDPKLSLTIVYIGNGYNLPQIAEILNENVRKTRYRWYRYRSAQRTALNRKSSNFCSKAV
jgi:DNA-directed RNA polymerase specialized sigma24 family protein